MTEHRTIYPEYPQANNPGLYGKTPADWEKHFQASMATAHSMISHLQRFIDGDTDADVNVGGQRVNVSGLDPVNDFSSLRYRLDHAEQWATNEQRAEVDALRNQLSQLLHGVETHQDGCDSRPERRADPTVVPMRAGCR